MQLRNFSHPKMRKEVKCINKYRQSNYTPRHSAPKQPAKINKKCATVFGFTFSSCKRYFKIYKILILKNLKS